MTPAEHYREALRLATESKESFRKAKFLRRETDPLNVVGMAAVQGAISRSEQLNAEAQTQALLSIAAANLPLSVLIEGGYDDSTEG
ncbi:hypothetical protein SEA_WILLIAMBOONE_101 [Gordonia phage WilliamBoone]|nr:hypothetical protein SEA_WILLIAMBOONE_101 [Gordonia phage WilliamBoone]